MKVVSRDCAEQPTAGLLCYVLEKLPKELGGSEHRIQADGWVELNDQMDGEP
jgi:hypothetical protein